MVHNSPQVPSQSGIRAALSAVAPDVREALERVHERLVAAGIPHVLVGGLAVGAHGYAYNTRDVDLLVAKNAAFTGDLIVEFRPGVPIRIGSVAVDYLTPEQEPAPVRRMMEEALETARAHPDAICVISAAVLVYMKLRVGRQKDLAAVVELLKAGLDSAAVEQLLDEVGEGQLSERFRRCVIQAAAEEDL